MINTYTEEARESPKETARQQREKRLKWADLGRVGGQGLSSGLHFVVTVCRGRKEGRPEVRLSGEALQGQS